MDKKVKLIWDFRGPAAARTAEHHEKHLVEFMEAQGLNTEMTGCDHLNEMYSMAYLVVEEVEVENLRKLLKPHRGQIFKP
ncbi:MAG: hypothetical protein ED555_14035 [Allomuricauda sp.]|nr:MAG: hypothetical protein ED555_14035 [Allomuricauda sp.]